MVPGRSRGQLPRHCLETCSRIGPARRKLVPKARHGPRKTGRQEKERGLGEGVTEVPTLPYSGPHSLSRPFRIRCLSVDILAGGFCCQVPRTPRLSRRGSVPASLRPCSFSLSVRGAHSAIAMPDQSREKGVDFLSLDLIQKPPAIDFATANIGSDIFVDTAHGRHCRD